MIKTDYPTRRLKYAATINDEALGEATAPDFELQYIDIGNVDSSGTIHDMATYRFEDAPSRARRRVRDGDVIVSTVRTYLQAIAPIIEPPENLIVSTGFAVVRPQSGDLDPEFCRYALREPEFLAEVVRKSVGVSYPAINASDLGDIRIPLPPLDRQRAIAAYLDRETAKLDAMVAAKERLLALLAEKRRAMITHAVTRGLNPDAPMKNSGVEWLGEIPAHWRAMAIKHALAMPITDGPHETPEFMPEGIPFLSAESVKDDALDFDRKRGFISREDHARFSKKYVPRRGDVYMVKSGATTGNVARVETDAVFNVWSPLAVLRPHRLQTTTDFLFHFMKSKVFYASVELAWSYGTQQNIGMGAISNLRIALPPLDEQHAITEYIAAQTQTLDELRRESEGSLSLLRERRSALIAAAVTGAIEVEVAA